MAHRGGSPECLDTAEATLPSLYLPPSHPRLEKLGYSLLSLRDISWNAVIAYARRHASSDYVTRTGVPQSALSGGAGCPIVGIGHGHHGAVFLLLWRLIGAINRIRKVNRLHEPLTRFGISQRPARREELINGRGFSAFSRVCEGELVCNVRPTDFQNLRLAVTGRHT